MSSNISDAHLLYGSSSPLIASNTSPTRSCQLIDGDGSDDNNYNPQDGSSPTTLLLRNKTNNEENDDDDDETSIMKARYIPILTRSLIAILAISLIGLVFGLLPYFAVEAGKKGHVNQTLYWIAGCFVLITVPMSVLGIVQHLVNWYMPQVQKVSLEQSRTLVSFWTTFTGLQFSHHFLLISLHNSSSFESSSWCPSSPSNHGSASSFTPPPPTSLPSVISMRRSYSPLSYTTLLSYAEGKIN